MVEDEDDDAEDEVPTEEGPSQPVVDGAEDPGVCVERQQQGGDPRGHAEILERIFNASSIFIPLLWQHFCKNSDLYSNLCLWHR